MEYNTDKRTKNLTLRDIHVGDWVQVWSETMERYAQPRKITQICDDGTVYLEGNEEGRPALWVENIKNVDALEITRELLEGFGFEVITKDYPKDELNVFYDGHKICEFWDLGECRIIETPWNSYDYFHEFIDGMYYSYSELLSLEWKGAQSSATHPKGMSL